MASLVQVWIFQCKVFQHNLGADAVFLLRFCLLFSMETSCWLNCDDWKMESAKNVKLYSIMPLTTENLFSIIWHIKSIDAVTASRPAELCKNRKSFQN